MTPDHEGPMAGRTVLVTGGTGGIGKATAAGLGHPRRPRRDHRPRPRARRGCSRRDPYGDRRAGGCVRRGPVVAGRGTAVGRRGTRGPCPRIDVLVNNVGGYWNTRHVTADGLERTFAVNHLAPFLLTQLLLERLGESGAGPRGHGVLERTHRRAHRLRGPAGGAVLLRRTGLQPVQARQHSVHLRARQAAAGNLRSPPTRCIPAWCAPPSVPRIPAACSECSFRFCGRS